MKHIDNKNVWKVQSHIFNTRRNFDWSLSHAQTPLPYIHPEGFLRIFYATRDIESRSSIGFIDVECENPSNILYEHHKPVLERGKVGFFDDSGTMPSCLVENNNKVFLYYTGWNKSQTASYRLAVGIAVSLDNGLTFKRLFDGPILDRDTNDFVWVGQPWVLKQNKIWKMWYLSCSKIELINNRPEPFYNVKYAESLDGINWDRKNITCIDFNPSKNIDSIGRPCVFLENGIYKMFHSNRSAFNYRDNSDNSYKIAYSESTNGKDWCRKEFLLDRNMANWITEMNCYSSLYFCKGRKIMLLNGSGFGKTGFGYAEEI